MFDKKWTELLPKQHQDFSEIRALHHDKLEGFRKSPTYHACAEVWKEHAWGREPGAEACKLVAKLPISICRLYLLDSGAFNQRLAVRVGNQTASGPLSQIGIDAYRFSKIIQSLTQLNRDEKAILNAIKFPHPKVGHTIAVRDSFCGYQTRIVADRNLFVLDPLTGEQCAAIDSFLVYGRMAYLFVGKYPFYLVTGGAGQKAIGFVIPALNVQLDFQAMLTIFLKPENASTVFAQQMHRIANNPENFGKAIRAPESARTAPKKIVLLGGQIENFAHHLWNFYPGVERILASGHADNIDEVRSYGSEFFGDYTAIFPEFKGKHSHLPRQSVVEAGTFDLQSLMVQPGGYFIPQNLLKRIHRAVKAAPTSHPANAAERVPVNTWPLIWIGLRLGSRAWVEQKQGILTLISRVRQRYPEAQFLLDGFSYPVGQDFISQKWQSVIDSLHQVAAEIREASGIPDSVHNLVGNGLDDSVKLAARVAAYIAPIGTTQHKIGWLSDAEGIVYSGPDIAKTSPEVRPGCWEAENRPVPSYILGKPASEPMKNHYADRRSNLQTISLDVEELWTALETALGRAEQARGRPRSLEE